MEILVDAPIAPPVIRTFPVFNVVAVWALRSPISRPDVRLEKVLAEGS